MSGEVGFYHGSKHSEPFRELSDLGPYCLNMSCSNASSYTPTLATVWINQSRLMKCLDFFDKTPFGHNPASISIKKLVLAFIWVWRFYAADCKNAGL